MLTGLGANSELHTSAVSAARAEDFKNPTWYSLRHFSGSTDHTPFLSFRILAPSRGISLSR